jgi:ABC-type glycerol-3-phosphate transport system substrate-binding protein
VNIWLSWSTAEIETLRTIIKSFQRLYPDITFNLLYIPLDDLFTTYQEAAYLGRGPGLLLGPAKWGPELFDGKLISDLSAYVPPKYLTSLNPAALDSGRYEGGLISLPVSQHGMVMFRNSAIIPTALQSFEQLSQLSHDATRAGIVGSYLERGAYFSAADILGLGGSIMNDVEQPTFTDAFGLEWIVLLHAYDQAGAVTFNTNLDLDMFMRGRAGFIIDGTWNIAALSQAIGSNNLSIDPWPIYGSGHLSGWVQADSVFLNSNITGNDRFAALAFMGYLLDPDVQVRLAEVGQIPSVTTAKPRDPLIQQAMQAFSRGVAYPITVDDNTLNLYWSALNTVIRDVFTSGVKPEDALKAASDQISQILLNSTPAP